MKNKEIQDLINFIKKSDLDDVSIETENYKIRVKKNQNKNTTQPKKVVEEIIETTREIQKPEPKQNNTKETNESNNHLIIKSPMIGTFYRASNPKSDPFIKEGDIMIVPQHLWHYTEPNKINFKKRILSFDFVLEPVLF